MAYSAITLPDSSGSAASDLLLGGNAALNTFPYGTSIALPAGSNTQVLSNCKVQSSGTAAVTFGKVASAPTSAQSGIYSASCFGMTVTTAQASILSGSYVFQRWVIDGFNYAKIDGQAFTISFWVYATVTGVYCVSPQGGGNYYVAEYTVNASNTWEYKTITIPAAPTTGSWNYTTGEGLVIYVAIATGASYQGTAGSWGAVQKMATSNQVNGVSSTSNLFRIEHFRVTPGTSAPALSKAPYTGYQDPAAAKVWGFITTSGGTPTLAANLGVSSIADNGVGNYTVTLSKDFSTANYAVTTGYNRDNTSSAGYIPNVYTLSTSSFVISTTSSTGAAVDPTSVSFDVFGTY